jgi:hypothetical protein
VEEEETEREGGHLEFIVALVDGIVGEVHAHHREILEEGGRKEGSKGQQARDKAMEEDGVNLFRWLDIFLCADPYEPIIEQKHSEQWRERGGGIFFESLGRR